MPAVPLQQVGDADEAGHEVAGGPLVHLDRGAQLLDPALVEHGQPVAHGERLLLVVRDVDERDADLALDPLQLQLHVLAQLGVQRAERLIQQQYLGLVDDGPGQRDPLPLPARQLDRLAAAEPAEADHVQGRLGAAAALGPGHPPHPQAVLHVLQHAHVREQRVVLEDGVDVPGVRRLPGDIGAAELDRAGIGPLEPRDQPQQRGLARPGGAEHGEELPLGDLQVDPGHRGERAERLAQRDEPDGSRASTRPRRRRPGRGRARHRGVLLRMGSPLDG